MSVPYLRLVWSSPVVLEPRGVARSLMPVRPPLPSRFGPPALLGKARRREWDEARAALGRAMERLQRYGPTWQGDVDEAEARLRALAERDYTRSALRRATSR